MSVDQGGSGSARPLSMETVEAAAKLLRERLRLTLFGFDVVVESSTGDSSFPENPDEKKDNTLKIILPGTCLHAVWELALYPTS